MGGGKEEAVLPPARPQLPLSLVWTSPGESPPSEPLRVTGTGAPRLGSPEMAPRAVQRVTLAGPLSSWEMTPAGPGRGRWEEPSRKEGRVTDRLKFGLEGPRANMGGGA